MCLESLQKVHTSFGGNTVDSVNPACTEYYVVVYTYTITPNSTLLGEKIDKCSL